MFSVVALSMIIGGLGTPTPPPGPARDNSGNLINHDATCPTGTTYWGYGPKYHLADECHYENDPNGPFFYNGMYHLFYQDHVTGGVVGGHAASRDLITWKRLEVALWNDKWYDSSSVYSFSATMVDGKPVIIYPGLTRNSSTGFCFAVAYPADLDDPYLLDWVKPASNPIRCDLETQRDPSSAWRTSFGEWRMTYFHGGVYTSQDFKRWDYVGGLFGGAECPDFYPLPNPTPGSEKASGASGKGQDAPNYVHATSGYQVGVYAEGARNTTGTWTPMEGGGASEMDGADASCFYAAKSFYDPVKDRRIVWGWIRADTSYPRNSASFHVPPMQTSMNSLPREVTWDVRVERLNFFPVAEIETLRTGSLGELKAGSQVSAADGFVSLLSGASSTATAANASHVLVKFALPTAAGRLGVRVMSGAHINGSTFGIDLFVDFAPSSEASWSVVVGAERETISCSSNYGFPDEPATDHNPSSDYGFPEEPTTDLYYPKPEVVPVESKVTESHHDRHGDHGHRTLGRAGDGPAGQNHGDHKRKRSRKHDDRNSDFDHVTAAAELEPEPELDEDAWRCKNKAVVMPMISTETELSLDVYVDGTTVEVFFQGGRAPMTVNVPYRCFADNTKQGVELFTNITSGVFVNEARIFSMGGIY